MSLSYDNKKFPKIVLLNSRHVSSIKQEGVPTRLSQTMTYQQDKNDTKSKGRKGCSFPTSIMDVRTSIFRKDIGQITTSMPAMW